MPVSQAYTSVSFYTRNEVAYYAINDRSAGRKVIELDLMTEEQHAELPEDEEVTAADRLIIDFPTTTGLIVLKALAPEPGLMPQAQAALAASSCKLQTEPAPVKQPEPAPAPAPAPPRSSADCTRPRVRRLSQRAMCRSMNASACLKSGWRNARISAPPATRRTTTGRAFRGPGMAPALEIE